MKVPLWLIGLLIPLTNIGSFYGGYRSGHSQALTELDESVDTHELVLARLQAECSLLKVGRELCFAEQAVLYEKLNTCLDVLPEKERQQLLPTITGDKLIVEAELAAKNPPREK